MPQPHEPRPAEGAPIDANRVAHDAGVDAVVAEWAVDEQVRARQRVGWLVNRAADEGTITGVLVDLAEHDATVLVTVGHGGRHLGSIEALGDQVLVLRDASQRIVALDLREVASVRQAPDAPGPAPVSVGGRHLDGHRSTTLAHLVAGWAGERPRVRFVHRSGAVLVGELRGAGTDVASVVLDGSGELVYVALDSLAEVSLESG